MSKGYDKSFIDNVVAQLLRPGSLSVEKMSKKLGVSTVTLYKWKKMYGKINDNPGGQMSIQSNENKKTVNSNIEWTIEKKLEALNKTYGMDENELGIYLRENGLHSVELENFKNEIISLSQSKGRQKPDNQVVQLKKENHELERTLERNQKALAELSARVILLKKSQDIWGVPEEEK